MQRNLLLRTNIIVCVIIIMGFIITFGVGYESNAELFEKDIEHVTILASEGIYSDIEHVFTAPINVSNAMANDALLKDLIKKQRENPADPSSEALIRDYLGTYHNKYGYDSVFLAVADSNTYYHHDGTNRILDETSPEDAWYFEFIDQSADYALFVDSDTDNRGVVTAFINCNLRDEAGNFIGVVGVGLIVEDLQSILQSYNEKYDVHAFLVDENGRIELSSGENGDQGVYLADKDYKNADILLGEGAGQSLWYSSRQGGGFMVTQYVPNLKWTLVVEKDRSGMIGQISIQFLQQMIGIVAITVLVLVIITRVIYRCHKQILELATHDALTGLFNRISYDEAMERHKAELNDASRIGIGIFDLNNLKHVNDTYGHRAGDAYIKACCKAMRKAFAGCDLFRIGGDEFSVILNDVREEDVARMTGALQKNIAEENKRQELKIGVAFGYAFYDPQTDKGLGDVFLRADQNMYENKQAAKDRP